MSSVVLTGSERASAAETGAVGVVENEVVTARATIPSTSQLGLSAALRTLDGVGEDLVGRQQVDVVGLALPGLVDRAARRTRAVDGKGVDVPARRTP